METDDLKDMLARSQDTAYRLGGLDRTAYATDTAGAVTVTVRADGSVVHARLHEQWRARLGSTDLGTAVAEAITSAQDKAARDWAESPGGSGPAGPSEPGSGTNRDDVAARINQDAADFGQDPVDFARELLALLDEVEARLPDLAGLAQEAVDREVHIGGPARAITAVARQGTLVRLDVDPQWMREAPRFRVEEELTAVLARALPGLSRQAADALREVGPVGRLLGLLDDPAALFGRLGLTADGAWTGGADGAWTGGADGGIPHTHDGRGAR